MTPKQEVLKLYERNAEKACMKIRSEGLFFLTPELIWQILIYELDHSDIPTEVLWHRLTTEEIIILTKAFFLKYGKPINVLESDDFYALSNPNRLSKGCIKHDGHKWTIHKIDVDPFPSKPHAHDYENHTKLHLGNGKLYISSGNVGVLPRKHLLAIREKILDKMPGLKLPTLEV